MDTSPTTVVHVLRHGEVHNPDGILYGRLPGFRLSDRGLAMADLVAGVLVGRDITVVTSSPLERAVETAAPVAAAAGVDAGVDPDLIEAASVFEGQRIGVGDGVLRTPSAWRHLWNPFRPSWGEPYVEVAARMERAVARAKHAARGHEAVLVSHQLPIWVCRLDAERRPFAHDPRHRQCALASLTSFTFTGDRLAVISYTEPARDLLAGASPVAGA